MKKSILIWPLIGPMFFCTFGQTQREVLTNAKILELVRLGLSETVVIEKIRQSECRCDTSTAELAKLKAAKVSDSIILAMMSPSTGGYSETPPTKQADAPKQVAVPPIGNDAESRAISNISEPGIYLFEDGEMKGIDPSVFSGTKQS